jgi:ubiquinone/menaquinone biosynthesis C-methylase UbiE
MPILNNILNRILKPLLPETIRRRSAILECAKRHDMFLEESEKYYSKVYYYFINQRIEKVFPNKKLKILDVGCGQGRLTIPLASDGHLVEGVDISPEAINLAKKYTIERNLNTKFWIKDVEVPFNEINSEVYDCILCIESIYMIKNYENLIAEMHRLLKKGGLLFIAFRSNYYLMLHLLKDNKFSKAELISKNYEGYIWNQDVYFNWHTRDTILNILSKYRLKDITFNGIGMCSGITGDPLSQIVEPKNLSDDEQQTLFEIETELSERYAEVGRYILISAIKS